jgi:hypothetical protein
MNPTAHGPKMAGVGGRLLRRAAGLREDERGQTMLLSGFMAFLLVIMAAFTANATKAIYHRVVAQNAVDAAADSAALWQARGCNLLQHLNNLHYDANVVMYIAEVGFLAACVAAPALNAIPFVGPALSQAACILCRFAPIVDSAQEVFSDILLAVQDGIQMFFPALAWAYGNAAAKGSGADQLIGALLDYINNGLAQFGISVPGFSDVLSAVGGFLSWVPIFAMPIDPTSLSLHVDKQEAGDFELPWHFPDYISIPMATPGVYCGINPADCDGWRDSYYTGNPGFMTWVAGKQEFGELLQMGDLIWYNAEKREAELQTFTYKMWGGKVREASTAGGPMTVPAFLGIASSQVEGDPVVAHGDANAVGHLITVQFPPDSDPTSGDNFLIWH